jgi:hypothetical protein
MDRLADEIRSELRRFGAQAGLAEVVERWPEAVGEAIARNAWPLRLGRNGTLHVATADSVWAFELAQRRGEIAERLGVPGVRFAPGPVPRAEPRKAPPPVVVPTTAERARATAIANEIEDENLRESVQKAVLFSLAREAADRPL